MEESTNFWNTKLTDMTVREGLETSVLVPICVMGGIFVAGAGASLVNKVAKLFRKSDKTDES